MAIYPLVYIALSLPLAGGRMAAARGKNPSIVYYSVAGSLITSSGLVDVLLYSLTRRTLLVEFESSNCQIYRRVIRKNKRTISPLTAIPSRHPTTRTEICARCTTCGVMHDYLAEEPRSIGLVPMGDIYQCTSIDITYESASPHATN